MTSNRCTYCRCTYSDEDLEGLHIVVTNSRTDMVQIVPAAAHEMFGCFSKVCLHGYHAACLMWRALADPAISKAVMLSKFRA